MGEQGEHNDQAKSLKEDQNTHKVYGQFSPNSQHNSEACETRQDCSCQPLIAVKLQLSRLGTTHYSYCSSAQ